MEHLVLGAVRRIAGLVSKAAKRMPLTFVILPCFVEGASSSRPHHDFGQVSVKNLLTPWRLLTRDGVQEVRAVG